MRQTIDGRDPASRSAIRLMYGSERNVPTTGNCRRKVNITGKKSPNKFRNPSVSMMTPKNGHLKNTSRIPPRKQSVPRSFCRRAKK